MEKPECGCVEQVCKETQRSPHTNRRPSPGQGRCCRLSSWPRPCVALTSSTVLFFQMRMYSFLVTKHILCLKKKKKTDWNSISGAVSVSPKLPAWELAEDLDQDARILGGLRPRAERVLGSALRSKCGACPERAAR